MLRINNIYQQHGKAVHLLTEIWICIQAIS